jgi:hypothetical protein
MSAGALDRDLGVGHLAKAVLGPGQRHHLVLPDPLEDPLAHRPLRQRIERRIVRHQKRHGEDVHLDDLRRPVDGRAHRHVDDAAPHRRELARLLALHQLRPRVDHHVDAPVRPRHEPRAQRSAASPQGKVPAPPSKPDTRPCTLVPRHHPHRAPAPAPKPPPPIASFPRPPCKNQPPPPATNHPPTPTPPTPGRGQGEGEEAARGGSASPWTPPVPCGGGYLGVCRRSATMKATTLPSHATENQPPTRPSHCRRAAASPQKPASAEKPAMWIRKLPARPRSASSDRTAPARNVWQAASRRCPRRTLHRRSPATRSSAGTTAARPAPSPQHRTRRETTSDQRALGKALPPSAEQPAPA